ncbi:hypothetical protein UR09_04395 [Candidatus Nitromaritima sp. SCGC AAA799-A02]|nr:hypothetical protein UR09_04395 [Candidatus Nitromaritima sp. SCGC AAA799-A02]KMP12007.1 hypothetical protein UZ36_02190 [Candidatus Nitromaritima sp. SCGC AAA799-C22]
MDDVRVYMSDPSITIDFQSTVLDTVKLMRDNHVGSILVTENGEITGIFTETDLLRKVAAEGHALESIKLGSVMSKPLVSIDADSSMVAAFLMMQQRNIRHLGVRENKKTVGVISIKDIANYYVNKFNKKSDKKPGKAGEGESGN